jgi:hypothetical protein
LLLTCVTPFLSILKRLMFQLPLLMALSSPYVIVSALQAATSNRPLSTMSARPAN